LDSIFGLYICGDFSKCKRKKKVEQKFNLGQSDKTLRGVKI